MKKGWKSPVKKRDNHAFSELQAVYREATGWDEDDDY